MQPTGGRMGIQNGGPDWPAVVGLPRRADAVERAEFSSFYAASFSRLVGQLYVMTGDLAEAQDAVQEAFIRAWARRSKGSHLAVYGYWRGSPPPRF